MVRNPSRLPALDDRDTGCQFLSERLRDRSGQAKGLNQILRWLGILINPEVIALSTGTCRADGAVRNFHAAGFCTNDLIL